MSESGDSDRPESPESAVTYVISEFTSAETLRRYCPPFSAFVIYVALNAKTDGLYRVKSFNAEDFSYVHDETFSHAN